MKLLPLTPFTKTVESDFAFIGLLSRNLPLLPDYASQMWAARPHLGSIFEKLLHRKTFQLPAARISAAISKNLTVLVFFHKNFPIT